MINSEYIQSIITKSDSESGHHLQSLFVKKCIPNGHDSNPDRYRAG